MTRDRVAMFREDIAASPVAFATFLDGWRPVDLGGRSRIAMYGLGSSRYAALVVASAASRRGDLVWATHAGAEAGPPPASDLAAVCVSASGGTAEVLEVARRHRGRSLVVAVTNEPASPLAELGDVVVPLEAGREAAGVSCRTYRATLAALALLTGVADVDGLRAVVPGLERSADDEAWVASAADLLDGAGRIDVVAPEPLLGAAGQAALMLREAPRLPAQAVETADWGHTDVYLALPGHRILRTPGSPADAELGSIVARRGGAVIDLPGPAGDPAPLSTAIHGSVRAELLAAELWDRASSTEAGGGTPSPLGPA